MKIKGNQEIQGNLNVTGNITKNGVPIDIQTTENSLINSKNVFDFTLVIYNSRVSNTNGTNIYDTARDSSGKQKVEPNTRYYITFAEFPQFSSSIIAPSDGIRAYYDINGNYINWSSLPLEADGSFITPSNVHYLQFSYSIGSITQFTQIVKADDLVSPITLNGSRYTTGGKIFDALKINVIDTELRKLNMPLFGKKWLALGDSITQQNKYAVFVKRATGLMQFQNLGVSGRQIANQAVLTGLTQSMIDEADVITCLAGINDYGLGSQPLGTIADASTVDSFYGDMRGVLETIYGLIETSTLSNEEKIKKLVCFATPNMIKNHSGFTPPAAGTGGKTLLQIRNAIMEVCAEFGTPVFDNYTLSGINKINMLGDGLHPTDEQSVYGIAWGKFLNSNYKNY